MKCLRRRHDELIKGETCRDQVKYEIDYGLIITHGKRKHNRQIWDTHRLNVSLNKGSPLLSIFARGDIGW